MSTPNTTTETFNNAMAVIESLNRESASEFWVPSLGRIVKFKPLTAANQRDMIATLAGTRYFPAALSITIYDIVKDTCIEPDISIDQFNSIDKIALILQLRASNIRDQVSLSLDPEVQSACNVLNDGLPFVKTTSIKSWVKSLKTKTFDLTPQVINDGKLKIEVAMPTFINERKFQQQIYSVARIAESGKAQMTQEQILGHVFLNTVCQYVHRVTVDDVIVNFADVTPDQGVRLLSKVKGTVLKQIGDAINRFDSVIKDLCTVKFNLNKNEFIGTVAVDNSLFEQ